MLASLAAQVFHDWAYREGLMPDAWQSAPISSAQQLEQITPRTEAGKQILRAREIQSIASNEPLRRIIVFTKKAAPTTKKQAAILPANVDDVEIIYRQGAPASVGTLLTVPFGGPAYVVRVTAAGGKYACGSSISVGNYRDAGTLGCLVRDASGQLYGLTNNHVSGSCSYAGIGLPIVAPGIHDVAPNALPPFTIGLHERSLPLVAGSPDNVDWKQNSDAAIFKIVDPHKVTSFQGSSYDTPINVGPLEENQLVEKVGRTTHHTTGRVIGQMFGVYGLPYQAAIYGFNGVVYFEPVFAIAGSTGLFSDSGDSGSLICALSEDGTRTAVGILVGGQTDGTAPGGRATIALPLQPILQRLGVTLVGGHNI